MHRGSTEYNAPARRYVWMSDELSPIVHPARPTRSALVVVAIVLGSIGTLYLLLVLVSGMGWDGY